MMIPLTLILHTHQYAIARLPAGAAVPSLAAAPSSGLRSITWTKDETSIVCQESDAPKDAQVEGSWRAFQVKGPLDFSLVGILAALSGTLATAGISLFALSTFDTDYILVREKDVQAACKAFQNAGHLMVQTDLV
jgi:uncharacterized protein